MCKRSGCYCKWSQYQIWLQFSYLSADITKIHKSYDNMGISTLFLHRAKVYLMSIRPLWWLITIHNMNKISHPFIPMISLQTYKMYELMGKTASFWDQATLQQAYIIVDYCSKCAHNQPILLWDVTTNTQKL